MLVFGLGVRDKLGLAFIEMVANRRTVPAANFEKSCVFTGFRVRGLAQLARQAMKDGSDAVSDWPALLIALLNTARARTWGVASSWRRCPRNGVLPALRHGILLRRDGGADRRIERVSSGRSGSTRCPCVPCRLLGYESALEWRCGATNSTYPAFCHDRPSRPDG